MSGWPLRTRHVREDVAEAAIARMLEPIRPGGDAWTGLRISYTREGGVDILLRDGDADPGGLAVTQVSVSPEATTLHLARVADDTYTDEVAVSVTDTSRGSALRIVSAHHGWHDVDQHEPEVEAALLAFAGAIVADARRGAAASPGSNLDRLLHPGEHYILSRTVRGGKRELAIDTAAVRRDWPGAAFGHRGGLRPALVRVSAAGHVAVSHDRDLVFRGWHQPGSSLQDRLRDALLSATAASLPEPIRTASERTLPCLATSNLLSSDLPALQLAQAAPLLARALLEQASSGHLSAARRKDTRQREGLGRIRDLARVPLRQVATAATTVQRSHWRGYRSRPWGEADGHWQAAPAGLVAFMRHDPGVVSADPRESASALLSSGMLEFLREANVDRVRALRDPSGWRLVRSAVACRRALGHAVLENPQAARRAVDGYFPVHVRELYDEDDDGDRVALEQIGDYLDHLRDQDLPTNLSFRRLAVDSRIWHRALRHQQADEAARAAQEDGGARLVRFAPCRLHGLTVDGLRLEQLRTDAALRTEGARMGHCVGGGWYASRCRDGESVIFSVQQRDPGGEWVGVATLELSGRNYRIRQLYGPGDLPVKRDVHDRLQREISRRAPRRPHPSYASWSASRRTASPRSLA